MELPINGNMTAFRDMVGKKGDKFSKSITITKNNVAVNLSTYTAAKLTIKKNENDVEILSFTNTGATYNLNISNLSTGVIIIYCPKLNIDGGTYYYDLQLSNSTENETIIEGKFIVTTQITI